MYDIIVIGAGPAGLVSALYARRAGKSVCVIEKGTFGGQITYSPKVENIPGFMSVSGNEFAEKLVSQVLELGAEIECAEALEIKDGEQKTVVTDSGEFVARAVIIATGATHRLTGAENEEKYIGEGVSFCAVCDGAFYEGRDVAVIGGGNSALQEALLLCETSRKVYIVQNLPTFTGEEALIRQVEKKSNIEVIFSARLESYIGEETLTGIKVKKTDDAREISLDVDGVFVAIGLIPQNEAFSNVLELDGNGYANSLEDCITKTNGIFVAGDCRHKRVRQVTTATSDGAVAALAAVKYLEK